MIRKKLKFTAALLLVTAHLFLGTGFAAAENHGSSLHISPTYINALNTFFQNIFVEEALEEVENFHVVAPGENLIRIARAYGMDVEVLAALNEISDPNLIQVGQELKVQLPAEITHTLKRGETLVFLAQVYGVDLSVILEANNIHDPYVLPVGMEIIITHPTRIPLPEPRVTLASRSSTSGRISSAPAISWPVQGTITSRFGVLRSTGYHLGLDIAAPTGTPIKAAAGGTVSRSERLGSYGLMVIVDHGGGWSTLYAHASRLLVSPGQRVSRGETIAQVGATGNTTGPHVHFEVIYNGKKLNPETYLPRR